MGLSVFEIIGPVMTGPSSSHTAGACRIGWAARQILGEPPGKAEVGLHGSFAATGAGHATREALTAGLLGLTPDSEKIPQAPALAEQAGMRITFREIDLGSQAHPNSVRIRMEGAKVSESVEANSPGGGAILITRIGPHEVHLPGRLETLLLWHRDTPGFLARITALLSCVELNVASIQTGRTERGENALTAVEIDGSFPGPLLSLLPCIPAVQRHSLLPVLPGS